MQVGVARETVDLSAFPDLMVVVLGFKVRRVRGLPSLVAIGRNLTRFRRDPPDGLLHQELSLLGWNHVGIRQYWRDEASLTRFTRSAPHTGWWRDFLSDMCGCAFWHEAYSARGGFEAIYVSMPERAGLATFAPVRKAIGPFMSSSDRLRIDAAARTAP